MRKCGTSSMWRCVNMRDGRSVRKDVNAAAMIGLFYNGEMCKYKGYYNA